MACETFVPLRPRVKRPARASGCVRTEWGVHRGLESRPTHGESIEMRITPGVPSAPPNPCSTRVWTRSGEKTDTMLCHTAPKRPSKKRSSTVCSPARGCSTTSLHPPPKPSLRPSLRPSQSRRQSSGLIVRGSTYYLRLRVPRLLVGVVGKTHVVKSLGTGYRAEAKREDQWELEHPAHRAHRPPLCTQVR